MKAILAVLHEDIQQREETYKKQATLNRNKRGPKPKKRKRQS